MAARYTVYCKRSVAHVAAADLLAGVRNADLHTIVEDSVPKDAILFALRQLRMEKVDPNGFLWYRLCYRPDGYRQIDVERSDWGPGLAAELLQALEAKGRPKLDQIRKHLQDVVDVVSASFGSSEGQEMAPILASEIVRWLAEQGEGIIRAPDRSWWRLGKYNEYQPL